MSNSAITGPVFSDVRRSPSGSAAAPSWSFADATGTGVYLASTDVLALSTAGVQRVVVDAVGNVGIGTDSPSSELHIASNNPVLILQDTDSTEPLGTYISYRDSDGNEHGWVGYGSGSSDTLQISNAYDDIVFFTGSSGSAAERMRIAADGSLSTSCAATIAASFTGTNASNTTELLVKSAGGVGLNTRARVIAGYNGGGSNYGGYLAFNTTSTQNVNTERMRIDADGNFLVGAGGGSYHRIHKTNPGGYVLLVSNGGTTAGTSCLNLSMSSANDSNGNFIFCGDYGAVRMYVKGNGGIANYSNNNTNLSDERVKTDINPAGSYLEKICAIPVKTFRYKDQGEDRDLNLGVIAQDVEAVAPELVNTTDGFGELPEDGVPLRTVYQTDLQYALMKCIQEQQAQIEEMKTKIAALESKP